MTDGTGTTTYSYDSLHRLTSLTDGAAQTISYGYDLANNETSITYPNQQTVTRTFDQANRLKTVTDWLGNTTAFGYDPDSNLVSTTFPATTGNVDTYGYDASDQLVSASFDQGQSPVATLAYTRDPLGAITNETQTGLPGPSSTDYSYNQLDQLTSAGSSNYSYDNAGNPTALAGATGYNYDNASQLTSSPTATYSYDQLGERTSSTPTAGGQTTYGYNQAGRLTTYTPPTGSATSFAYNGDGIRTSTTTGNSTNHFEWDLTAGIPALLSDGQNNYIYGPGNVPIEQINQAGTPTYLHHDQLGSTRLITDQAGNAVGTFTYNPYGTLTASTGSATTPFGYADEYTDSATGLEYNLDRYYDPTTGQFISGDPLQALTQQPYAYAADTPTNATDPTGLDACGDIIGVSQLCGALYSSGVSNFAAGVLSGMTGGFSTQLAGAAFSFNSQCANFGTAGNIGEAVGLVGGLLDGESEEALAAEGGDTVSVFHGSLNDASDIQANGLDASRGTTFVSRDPAAAADAIGPNRPDYPGADPGIIESQIPKDVFDQQLAPNERAYGGFYPYPLDSTEIPLRTPEQIGSFNRYIVP